MARTRTGHRATLLRTIDEVDDVVGTVHAGVVVWLAEPELNAAERARFAMGRHEGRHARSHREPGHVGPGPITGQPGGSD